MAKTTVIIPVFNRSGLTQGCLASILGKISAEIVVVDDASTDTTSRLLSDYGDAIQVVTHPTNRGFATSCNDGSSWAKSQYLVFLNNDTIPQPGWLEALEQYADSHPLAAVVGAKLVYPNQTVQHAGVVICQDRFPRHIYCGFPAAHPAVSRSRRFQIVTAACMLIRRHVFEEVRGFDGGFQNGFEDVDLCLRLGERGHEVHFCADSTVIHLESVSPGRFSKDRENVSLYRERWGHRVQPDDIRYYLEDGLFRLTYEGRYPINIEVSPRLGIVADSNQDVEKVQLSQETSRQIADLVRENARLRAELGVRAQESPELEYQKMRRRIRKVVQDLVPAGATVLVASKGDGLLLKIEGRRGWHFPQTGHGAYAGHHPADSAEAIAHLEQLRARGAGYLLIPATSSWWLAHYVEFHQHLVTRYSQLEGHDDLCHIFDLNAGRKPTPWQSGPRKAE